ncbi:MAG: AbrB family transcriptional regulator [Trichodesmium sp. MO_231.B1]|nr:AbrB family transcriptional regulator [Trichodesmium sp. MO_231.B1]
MGKKKNPEPLQGKELLEKVKELDKKSKEEKARECGYYTVTKSGVERVNMMKFLNALIDAEGIELDGKQNGNGRGGRSASYKISVQSNGNLLIGAAYTKQMDLQPGDEFEISLGRKHIHLRQVEAEAEEEEEEEEEEEAVSAGTF